MKTYEELCREAAQMSLTNKGFSAVVEIINYRTGNGRMTIMSGRQKIVTKSRGPEFVGVNAQFFNGQPCK